MKPIEEMTGLELREPVAVEIMGVHVKKQRGARSHLRDLVIPGGVDGIDFVQEEDKPELTVHALIKGVPAYESSIEAAFQVVEKMREKGWSFLLNRPFHNTRLWWAEFGDREKIIEQGGDTAPLAICRASLKAVRAK